jgi:predicted SnoaL-like aldol condensation-catalyzing enzyme
MLTKKQGKEACVEGFDIVNGSNSDMKVSYLHMYAEGDYVFAHTSMSGKMNGSMAPGMPTINGSYTDIDFFEVIRYENGKCAERWGLMDGNKMMAQIAATNTATTEQPK